MKNRKSQVRKGKLALKQQTKDGITSFIFFGYTNQYKDLIAQREFSGFEVRQ